MALALAASALGGCGASSSGPGNADPAPTTSVGGEEGVGGATTPPGGWQVDPAALTTSAGCGEAFAAANEAQTVTLVIEPGPEVDLLAPGRGSIGDDWAGEVRFGRYLLEAWCGGVIEHDPQVAETWQVVAGDIEFTPPDMESRSLRATATATGLVAVDPDGGRHDLGDVELVNNGWGLLGE